MKTMVDTRGMTQGRLLEYFLVHPTSTIHLRGLARALHVSPPGVMKASRGLVKENIIEIKKDREKKLTILKAKKESPIFLYLKRSFNLYQLPKSGLLQYLIEEYEKPAAIVLFGSYARGEDTEGSDIDIAVLTKRHVQLNLSRFEKKLTRDITILELQREKIEKEFWNTLANGIVLYGYLELP